MTDTTQALKDVEIDRIACDNIDRLMNVEMRSRVLPRGGKWPMFLMAREAAGMSLVEAAAREFYRPPCRVLLVSGAAVPKHMPVGENDGPIGTVVLCRALKAIGHEVAILTDPIAAEPFRGLLRAYKPGNFDIAVGMSMPLDFRVRKQEQAKRTEERAASMEPSSASPAPAVVNLEPAVNPESRTSSLSTLRENLIREGFLNVKVGSQDKMLVVEYENSIFNQNELDALGVVAGISCMAAPEEFITLRIVTKKRNIKMMSMTVPLNGFRSYLERSVGHQELKDRLILDFNKIDDNNVSFISGDDNSGMFNTSLMLAPGLKTFIGTDFGVFDYLLSLKPELTTQLWKGAAINARWDIPLSWSDSLEDGEPFRNDRKPAQMERLMLFQAVKPLPSLMLNFGAGMVAYKQYGMLNEAVWSPGAGSHQFRVVQGLNEDDVTKRRADLLLGSYRYYYGPLDISLEGTVGKFLSEDVGGKLELKRFWEDTSVSFYYKDTKGADDIKWQAVGIQFSFPLTPRRDMKPVAKLQLRGTELWSYTHETTLIDNNGANTLPSYALAGTPQPSTSLYRSFLNQDRLNESYIKNHLGRLREAWLKYKK